MDWPGEVIGFRGTSRDAVAHLLARDIRSSDEHFEWLGTGFYLWQDSPWRNETVGSGRSGRECSGRSGAACGQGAEHAGQIPSRCSAPRAIIALVQ